MKQAILFSFISIAALFLGCGSEKGGLPEVDMVPPNPPASVSVEILDQEIYGGWVLISWAPNSEPDLAGYKVYKSSYENGPFTLVPEARQSLIKCPWYYDNPVPMEVTYYKVTAVDQSGNESAYSIVTGVYWNRGGRGQNSSMTE